MKKLILFIVILLSIFSCKTIHKLDFDVEIWNNPESYKYNRNDITDRQKMINSVINRIKGKTKDQIIALLGEGADTNKFLTLKRDLIYVLGPERSYVSIDYEWLLLWFDENDILEKYVIQTD